MVPVSEAARCIRGEYLELPGLSLTRHQVQRLYTLDEVTCEAVLAALVDVRFLARTPDGRYVRSGSLEGTTAPASRRRYRAA